MLFKLKNLKFIFSDLKMCPKKLNKDNKNKADNG